LQKMAAGSLNQRQYAMSQASPKRILLVEDSDGLRRVYQKLLEAYCFQVLTARHGSEALDVLENHNVDVVVSDIGMPVMDGFELARNLRAHPLHHSLRLIALTAYSQPTLVDEARRVGFDTYLAKPINIADLCQAIEGGEVSTDHLRPVEVQHSAIPEDTSLPPSAYRRQLRAATQDLHDSLEQKLDLLRPNLDLRNYRQLLERTYGYYEPLEARLTDFADHKSWSHEVISRCKSSALQADLRWLGVKQQTIADLPRATQLPPVENFADVLGVMYVLEGASLGGKVLARHFHSRWGLSKNGGASFFNFYGPELTENWDRYIEWLESSLSEKDLPRAIATARATFETMSTWLLGVTNDRQTVTPPTSHTDGTKPRSHRLRP
jgi:heme oxygenase (biliverdin-IX-beta and delta-forming)